MKSLVIDTHVHFYSCYNLELFISSIFANFDKITSSLNERDVVPAIILTERSDCSFYQELKNNKHELLNVSLCKDFLKAKCIKTNRVFFVFPGRQIITTERLEVLYLGEDLRIKDGEDIDSYVKNLSKKDGLVVLNWSFGKWLGSRGKIIKRLINESNLSKFVVADVSNRPSCSFMPTLLKKAKKMGFSCISGSDSLPLKGQEIFVGNYPILLRNFEADFSFVTIKEKIKKGQFEIVGVRRNLFRFVYDFFNNKFFASR